MQTQNPTALAIITVGDGRGFIVQVGFHRFVITAAHCLPFFPPCCSVSYTDERTYKNLLAPLGQPPSVWAECVFVDPIADIAVLGTPDDQAFAESPEICQAYEALVNSVSPLSISDAPEEGPASLLSLSGEMMPCVVRCGGHALWTSNVPSPGIVGGMSGSPIMAADDTAIGICATGSDPLDGEHWHTEGGPNPCLTHHLPGWLLFELKNRRGD
jgi:hypothetical protein